jgi:DNA repair protein RecN (Recombination protein N)
MPHGVFAIEVALMNAISPPKAPTISSSASPLTPVSRCSRSKVASGGELSRIALAIQVITARKMETRR